MAIGGVVAMATSGLFDSEKPWETWQKNQPIKAEPFDGLLSARIWKGADANARQYNLMTDPRALPVREDESLQLEVTMFQPSYVYLFWVDGAGTVMRVYPIRHNQQGKPEAEDLTMPLPPQEPAGSILSPPPDSDGTSLGWQFDNTAGLETIVLLARSEPLPDGYSFAEKIGELPPAPLDPVRLDELVIRTWRNGGEIHRTERNRAPKNAVEIDNQLERLVNRLKDDFELIRTIQFAHAPKVGG